VPGNDPTLDLSRSRSVGELMATTLETYRRNFSLFLSVTLLVVAPVTLLLEGVWQRELLNGSHQHERSGTAATVSALIYAVVVPAFVTALHTVIIAQLGRGTTPRFAGALREAAPRLPEALATVLLYTVGVAIGWLLFIVPGIWLMVRWCLAVQNTIVRGSGPTSSLAASTQLVSGRWWRTFGALLAAAIAFGLPAVLLDELAGNAHNGVLYVTLEIVIEAIFVSLTSVYGALLFFSWRAQRSG
jgi:hypothetical protein